MSVFTIYLENIDKAISEEDINSLYNIVKSVKMEDLKPDETVKLPYEKPPIINQIFANIKDFISVNFERNIFFRFISLMIILSIIAAPFFPIERNTIFWIGTMSAALAAGYKSRI